MYENDTNVKVDRRKQKGPWCVCVRRVRNGVTERYKAELGLERGKSVGGQTSYKGLLLYDLTDTAAMLNLWREMFLIQKQVY
jgi:hypothetical protein